MTGANLVVVAVGPLLGTMSGPSSVDAAGSARHAQRGASAEGCLEDFAARCFGAGLAESPFDDHMWGPKK